MLHTDAKHWRDRAAEALLLAANMHDESSRWHLIEIAVGYERLAKQAEATPQRVSELLRSDWSLHTP